MKEPSSVIKSLILFTSPESLLLDNWFTMIKELIIMNKLLLICIDEVHMFIEYALSFRKKFCLLKDNFFQQIIQRNNVINDDGIKTTHLLVPLICMTATFNESLLLLLQKMTNITFKKSNHFWSN